MTDKQEQFQEYLLDKLDLQSIEYDDLVHKLHKIVTDFVKDFTDEEIAREMD